jgi:hypothetical protein
MGKNIDCAVWNQDKYQRAENSTNERAYSENPTESGYSQEKSAKRSAKRYAKDFIARIKKDPACTAMDPSSCLSWVTVVVDNPEGKKIACKRA